MMERRLRIPRIQSSRAARKPRIREVCDAAGKVLLRTRHIADHDLIVIEPMCPEALALLPPAIHRLSQPDTPEWAWAIYRRSAPS